MTSEEQELLERNPNDAVPFRNDEFLSVLITAIADELQSFNVNGNQVRKNLFVEQANRDGLSDIGQAVNQPPRDGESTSQYRLRIRAALARATSGATIQQFATIAQQILNTPAENITFEPTGDIPVVVLRTTLTTIEESPFDSGSIIAFLDSVVPAGHSVRIETDSSLILDGPDFSPPEGTGLNEGALGGELR